MSLLLSDIQIENTPISATIKKRVHKPKTWMTSSIVRRFFMNASAL